MSFVAYEPGTIVTIDGIEGIAGKIIGYRADVTVKYLAIVEWQEDGTIEEYSAERVSETTLEDCSEYIVTNQGGGAEVHRCKLIGKHSSHECKCGAVWTFA